MHDRVRDRAAKESKKAETNKRKKEKFLDNQVSNTTATHPAPGWVIAAVASKIKEKKEPA